MPEPPPDQSTVIFRDWPWRIVLYLCPRHGTTKNVVGMGRDRPPLCAITDCVTDKPCGTPVEVGVYTRVESDERQAGS